MHGFPDDWPGLYLECGGHLIGLVTGDDVVLKVLDDSTDFGANWTIWNSGSGRCRY